VDPDAFEMGDLGRRMGRPKPGYEPLAAGEIERLRRALVEDLSWRE
jgi:hypothetical protein